MKVILSIKPEFAEKIFDGTKRYEFRRTLYRNAEVEAVVVYASAPVSKIIGEFQIETVLYKKLGTLWQKTRRYAGITHGDYRQYFVGKETGYAIKVREPKKYKRSYCIRKRFNIAPPQSFAYIKN